MNALTNYWQNAGICYAKPLAVYPVPVFSCKNNPGTGLSGIGKMLSKPMGDIYQEKWVSLRFLQKG
jgi:hypothetical protein